MQYKSAPDKRQLINLVIFSVMTMGIMFYFQPGRKGEEQKEQRKEDIEIVNPNTLPNNSGKVQMLASSDPVLLKNNFLDIDVSPSGGRISKVKINDYKAYDKTKEDKPVLLFSENNSSYGFRFRDNTGKILNTKDLSFVPIQKTENSVTLQADIKGSIIQFIYTLSEKYTVSFHVKTRGILPLNDKRTDFFWDYDVREIEKGRSQEQSHTEFVYAFDNYKKYDYDSHGEMDERKELLNWIGVKQQFFVAVLEAEHGFKNSFGEQTSIEEGEYIKKFNYSAEVAASEDELNQNFNWYFMPLNLDLLKSYDKKFEKILPLGWSFIGTMNRGFILMYEAISSWGISAGWVIFLMTIFVKIILSPIMYKQHKLSAMMRIIRPEIEEVQEKHKNADPMKKQHAVMEVYRKAGVNQFSGCIPGLLQIPIFYALFRFFPNMLDLRGKSFWFVDDLTTYDDLIKLPFNIPLLGDHLSIFAVSCTAVIMTYTLMTAGNMQQPKQAGMPNMKILMYIFPITFLFFLNSAASGLSWYYFVSNAINIILVLVIKYFILDEKKIHALIQANKAKPKREGKFQKRMREMMEKAQEQQKQIERQKKKK